MSDTTAKIRGKGLEHTGVTEEHANHMYNNIGSHYVGVVDLKVVQHSVDDKGKRTVELVIDTIEVAPNDDTAEHIRRLTRAFHYERGLAVNGGDQLPIEGNDEPTVEQVRAAGREHEIDPEADERAAAELEGTDTDDEDPGEPPTEGATYDHDLKVWIDADGNTVTAEPAGDPWEYPQPEGTAPDRPVDDPFALTTT
jgi:hypothetical protein